MRSLKLHRNYLKISPRYQTRGPGAEEKYKEVQEAYETLSDETKRAAYDHWCCGCQWWLLVAERAGLRDGAGFGGFEACHPCASVVVQVVIQMLRQGG